MEGQGEVEFLNSTLGSVEVDWRSRAGETEGKTSPEELIAAAHSACYSMALSHALAGNGTPPWSMVRSARFSSATWKRNGASSFWTAPG